MTSTLLADLTYFTANLWWWTYSDICHLFCLCPLLSSLCLYMLQDEQTVSHSWQDIWNSQAFCWCSSSSSWGHLWSCQLSWHISLIFSLFIYCRMRKQSHSLGKTFGKAKLFVDVHHLFIIFTAHLWWWTFLSHPFCLCPLLSSLCLSSAGCANSLTLLAKRLSKPGSLLTFITP